MGLLIGTIIFWVVTIFIYHNWWFVIFMTVDTILVLCRLKGILFKFKTMIKWEVLAIIIPVIFSLVFKRFKLIKTIVVIVVRGLFLLLVKYDMEEYLYPKERIKVIDDEENF